MRLLAHAPLQADLIGKDFRYTATGGTLQGFPYLPALHIDKLRQGADGRNKDAPNAANYDESKATPYPDLPELLVLKNGKKVKTAKDWWEKRRPEIVEDFDREIYGRTPKNTPKVTWEVTKTSNETNGDVPASLTDALVGRLCQQKDYVLFVNYPGLNPSAVLGNSVGEQVSWIRARFSGQPAPSNCH